MPSTKYTIITLALTLCSACAEEPRGIDFVADETAEVSPDIFEETSDEEDGYPAPPTRAPTEEPHSEAAEDPEPEGEFVRAGNDLDPVWNVLHPDEFGEEELAISREQDCQGQRADAGGEIDVQHNLNQIWVDAGKRWTDDFWVALADSNFEFYDRLLTDILSQECVDILSQRMMYRECRARGFWEVAVQDIENGADPFDVVNRRWVGSNQYDCADLNPDNYYR